jgi:hypothetical protein
MVVITADPKDVHALAVAKRVYDLGEDCCILDPADFPTRCQMQIAYSGNACEFSIRYGGETIRSESVSGLWLRRFRSYEIDPAIVNDEIRRFVYEECREFFQGWATTIPNVINSNIREFNALRKVYQLRVAQEVGLKIPRTSVGNDPEAVAGFCRPGSSETVYKVLSGTSFGFFGTQSVTAEKLDRIEACKFAPTIFQERIRVAQNLRVTVVDDQVFAAEVQTHTSAAELDWRLDMTPTILSVELPADIRKKLLALQNRLGLRYGAIDLIRDDNDEYVFLEVNPGGQFLFVEIATGMPISVALANALSGRI